MRQIIVNPGVVSSREGLIKLFDEESALLDKELATKPNSFVPRALIIDGPSLITAMANDDVKDKLLELSKKCKAVVGCRVSPDQKRQMVSLIKTGVSTARTLSIGDGANDVAMIQEAHIGVGIKGEEGVQAVNAADYAIAQFRFLGQLVLQHGRYNYVRMSSVICYMFYKVRITFASLTNPCSPVLTTTITTTTTS
jgi:magnesium-transporting ATPase (P-type)